VPDNLAALLKDARKVLSCERNECDRYCHGCLLGYDTQEHAEYLNRQTALGFLSQAFIDSLALPAGAQLFGDASLSELGDVTGSVLAELGRCGGGELRVYGAGVAADWDLARWSFDRHLQPFPLESIGRA
jgi:DEAD/DEAH box helicase domain-containing protein